MRFILSCAAVAAMSVAAAPAACETIELTDAYQVTGQILKSDGDAVFVDLGFDVVRIPRAKIDRIVADEDPATRPAAATRPGDDDAPAWRLYHAGGAGTATIEQNVRRVGEAVVMVTSPGGQGSGFFVTADGYCITNYHVIAKETRLKITVFGKTDTGFEQKHYKNVKIVALNPFVDLALLKVDGAGDTFTYAPLGRMDEISSGRRVFAIGNPLGLTRTVSQGIVSTTNRNFEGRLYIQTTTDINPGNSGGPLFNLKGEVVGVTSMGYIFLGGLNFAIPVDVVKGFIDNRDAFAYDEDNPNTGNRYLQPGRRIDDGAPPEARVPSFQPSVAVAPTPTENF